MEFMCEDYFVLPLDNLIVIFKSNIRVISIEIKHIKLVHKYINIQNILYIRNVSPSSQIVYHIL